MVELKCPVFLDARKMDKVIQAQASIKTYLITIFQWAVNEPLIRSDCNNKC